MRRRTKRVKGASRLASPPGVWRMRDAVKPLGKLYSDIDDQMSVSTGAVDDATLTCKLGCTACCRQLVSVSIPEALYVLVEYGSSSFVMRVLPKIWAEVTNQVALLYKGKSSEELREQGVACPFLYDEKCRIYEWRPLVCRLRTSFDDSNLCSISDAKIRQLDTSVSRFKAELLLESICKDLRIPNHAMPFPLALTFAQAGIVSGLYEMRDSLRALSKNSK